jgi:hypothetical protein
MSDRAPLEFGRWYRFEGLTPTQRGRPVRIRRHEHGVVLGRFADGSERLVIRDHIGDPVEHAVPGVTEPCLICGGKLVVPVIVSTKQEPWSGRRVGTRTCPNCRGLR